MPKIKIHYFSPDAPRLQLTKTGDWIDLYCAQDMTLHAGDFALVPLGVSMQLPEGYEARTAPRSSTFKRWGLLQANSVGVIDSDYRGEIRGVFQQTRMAGGEYKIGDRFCQLVLVPIPEVTLNEVPSLSETSRGVGGYGSTGN